MLYKVRIEPYGFTDVVEADTLLADVLRKFMIEFPCGGKGVCGNCKVRIISGNITTDNLQTEILKKKGLSSEWRLACLSKIKEDIVVEVPNGNMNILLDSIPFRSIAFVPEVGYGIAVDLGTTTVVSQLVSLESGMILETCSGVNPQSAFGADIISRISYALESANNAQNLTNIIRSFIGAQIEKLQNNIFAMVS